MGPEGPSVSEWHFPSRVPPAWADCPRTDCPRTDCLRAVPPRLAPLQDGGSFTDPNPYLYGSQSRHAPAKGKQG